MGQFKKYLPLTLITLLAIFLRAYRLDILTTFGRDQGIDFLTIRDILTTHHLTLIGIKVSFADFFQGPDYLYVLLPFFWIFRLNPIAGAVAAIFVSTLSLIFLYYSLQKFIGVKSAIFGSLLFAVSPEFIKFGNTPLYQHFAPLFIVLSIHFILEAGASFISQSNRSLFLIVLSGLFTGISMELHFLSTSLAISIIIFLIIFTNKKIQSLVSYGVGLFVGISPTILFELKHNFLNTHYFLNYLESGRKTQPLGQKVLTWITGSSLFFGADIFILGVVILALVLVLNFKKLRFGNKKVTENFLTLQKLSLVIILVNVVMSIILTDFGWWYNLPVWIVSLILIASFTESRQFTKIFFGLFTCLILVNLYISVSYLNENHGYSMADGWSLNKIEKVSNQISNDAVGWRSNFNVLSLIDGDSRAYPLRYVLEVNGKTPGKVTGYNSNNALYVISKETPEKVEASNLWEFQQFSPSVYGANWDMGDGVFLYRFDKILPIN